jgi:hypothetical protein
VRFEDGPLLWKQIRTCKQTAEYQRILSQWWQSEPRPARLEDGILRERLGAPADSRQMCRNILPPVRIESSTEQRNI